MTENFFFQKAVYNPARQPGCYLIVDNESVIKSLFFFFLSKLPSLLSCINSVLCAHLSSKPLLFVKRVSVISFPVNWHHRGGRLYVSWVSWQALWNASLKAGAKHILHRLVRAVLNGFLSASAVRCNCESCTWLTPMILFVTFTRLLSLLNLLKFPPKATIHWVKWSLLSLDTVKVLQIVHLWQDNNSSSFSYQ